MATDYEMISPYIYPGINLNQLDVERYPCLQKDNRRLSRTKLLEIISKEVGVSIDDIFTKSRNSELVFSRHMYQKIQSLYGDRITKIAREVSCDHTTVIHAITTFDNLYQYNETHKSIVDRVFEQVGIEFKKYNLKKYNLKK